MADRIQILSDEDQDDFAERTPEVVDLNEVTENNDTTIASNKTEKNLVDNSMKHY